MSEPIRVYPTEKSHIWKTGDGATAQHWHALPGIPQTCAHCNRVLAVGEAPHWHIGYAFYCNPCVEIMPPQEVPHD